MAAIAGGAAIVSGVSTTPVGGIGVLKIAGGFALFGVGQTQFAQGMGNIALGFAGEKATPDLMKMAAEKALGQKGAITYDLGMFGLSLLIKSPSGTIDNKALKAVCQAIAAGSTIQNVKQVAEDVGLKIEIKQVQPQEPPPPPPIEDSREKLLRELELEPMQQ